MADATKSAPGGLGGQVDIKNPDAVQKSILDFWGWIESNIKIVLALVVVLIIAAIANVAFHSFRGYQERKAQETYYSVEAKFTKIREGFDRAKYKALMPALAKDDKSTDKAATGDLAKDYGTVISDLEKVARDQAGTVAGGQAAILAAETYLEYKQPEKAIEVAQVAAKSLGDKNLVGSLSKVLLGSAMATKGDCQGAVGVWQQILDNKAAVFLHSDVSLRSGLCYEQLGQADKAAEMYRKVAADGSDSASASTAKGLLRALELKSKSATPAKQG